MAGREELLRRQEALADFGDFALRSDRLEEVLTEGCRLVGQALGTDLAKVLEIDHGRRELLVRAGVGWRPGVVGETRLPMGERSSETFAIESGTPVVVDDIRQEERFALPAFMAEHGVASMVNVPIFLPGGEPYGLLQVDSLAPRDFGEEEVAFLRTYAAILGPVIDRLHKISDLREALDANRRLLQEVQHRIKNHIAIIASLVQLRRRAARSDEARAELEAVGARVETLRLVHEQLYAAGSADRVRLRPFLTRLAEGLRGLNGSGAAAPAFDLALEDFELEADVAVPLGLILNEFVTNSLKHAFGAEGGGRIRAAVERRGGAISVRLSDNGPGLAAPPRGGASPGSGTGMRLIEGLAGQIGARPYWSTAEGGGTALRFDIPLG